MSDMVLCFGGPLDGQVVGIERGVDHRRAPMRERSVRHWRDVAEDVVDASTVMCRTVDYDVRRLVLMGAEYRCATATGYPLERIIDQANAIHAMATMPLVRWLGGPTSAMRALAAEADAAAWRGFVRWVVAELTGGDVPDD